MACILLWSSALLDLAFKKRNKKLPILTNDNNVLDVVWGVRPQDLLQICDKINDCVRKVYEVPELSSTARQLSTQPTNQSRVSAFFFLAGSGSGAWTRATSSKTPCTSTSSGTDFRRTSPRSTRSWSGRGTRESSSFLVSLQGPVCLRCLSSWA